MNIAWHPLPVVVVTTRLGTNIKGLLVRRARNGLVLRAAAIASVEQASAGSGSRIRWTPMAGDVVIPLENVDYYQTNLGAEVLE